MLSRYENETYTSQHMQMPMSILFLKKWAKPGLFLFISFFSHDKYSRNLTINDKSIDGVFGTRTRGGRMVGTDESTELWRHPPILICYTLELFFLFWTGEAPTALVKEWTINGQYLQHWEGWKRLDGCLEQMCLTSSWRDILSIHTRVVKRNKETAQVINYVNVMRKIWKISIFLWRN